ncbi:MAG: methyltransferase, TrmH family [Acidimicrobiaceae bacterium]
MKAGGDRAAVEHLRELARRRTVREEERRYLVDGPILVASALRSDALVHGVYVEVGRHEAIVDEASAAGVRVHVLPPGAIARFKATDVVTPQGIVAVTAMPDTRVSDAVDAAESGVVLVLCGLSDPGNAGTMLRMAEASGVSGVLFCDGSVDPFAPKCVRASAGSIFHVLVVSGGVPVQVLEAMGGRGVQRLGTDARRGKPYDEVDLTGSFALVLGNESHGLPPELADHLDGWVHVPMAGDVESLNVAMAASVICFDAARQRRGVR